MSARYAVGIDLGTTHCALAYVDLEAEGAPVEVLAIPQLVAPSAVEAKTLLPSFLYFAHSSEGPQALPWDAMVGTEARRYAVGEHARARGADAPGRVVSSAKSWLGHPTLDRRSPVLPLHAAEDVEKVSPVEASFRYLEHLREAWLYVVAKGDPALALERQDVVLTVPASFDAGARDLTVEAAFAAGLENVTLLEEPQAALYAWIAQQGDAWRKSLKVGDVLVVIDVGGGTTDFSAIAVGEKDGTLELSRVAVGDHILLGGDNMDLALAYRLKEKLEAGGAKLDRAQIAGLTFAARIAKERLFGEPGLAAAPVALASRGSKLFGAALRTELTREELEGALVEGFFPVVASSARPATRARTALTQLGLPYAQDAAITRHLAAFLGRQAGAAGDAGAFLRPTALLFNGGVMKADALRGRIVETLSGWLSSEGAPAPRVLGGADLDLAVARGAAAYALARRGKGYRIRGGTARAYYVGVEGAAPAVPGMEPPVVALCVAPFGMEEGSAADLPPVEVGAVVGEPVRFRFFGSSVRRQDHVGTELEDWSDEELEELAPVEVVLPAEGRRPGDVVPVRLGASVTEVGTLLVEAVPVAPLTPGERWRVELNVRAP